MAEYIKPSELVTRLAGPTPPLVVDVRIGQIGQIPGAVHVPVLDLEDSPQDWDRDREIVVFCQFGKGASEYAAEVLEEQGFRHIYKLVGGMDGWNAYLSSLMKRGDGV
ncbi:rhodanese-like domain-containing protein [Sulfobacillus harzensis]|uniref:Rhodanese-like domain-containing protein n=1 Tax=Sulfobacillus harzensis TaxID=2729629 RepID=A0A7Y0Q124_9FIRM|nr:rhodanese-like domain-containing protein [Sulfobacillus harzensis]NMP21017.1 rhodanese-like domain-containing protein [Sulfobacillus harzensis]